MQLFQNGGRIDAAYKRHSESLFEFIDRSSRPDCEVVRVLLNKWFDKYPSESARGLARRFRADFHPCCFELVLHQILTCAGYDVRVEPTLPMVTTRPDFLARRGLGEFYLEAVTATDESDADRARKARENELYDAINSLEVADYFLIIKGLDIPSNTRVVPRRVQAFVKRVVADADWLALSDICRTEDLGRLPSFEFIDGRLRLTFQLLPKTEQARGAPSRAIGMHPFRFRWGDAAESIKRAIERKAAKYGTLGRPFVIAVNSTSEWGGTRLALLDALYGTLAVSEGLRSGPATRANNGLFGEAAGSLSERVSAVLIGTVWPWALRQSRLELFHNPMARVPLPADALPFPQFVLRDRVAEEVEGPPLTAALHIADAPQGVGLLT